MKTWLSQTIQRDLEQCVLQCEVRLIDKIISDIRISHVVINVIQDTLECTAFQYRMISKDCNLYGTGEFSSGSSSTTQHIISGICPKGTNIDTLDNRLKNEGFYCDKNGKIHLMLT